MATETNIPTPSNEATPTPAPVQGQKKSATGKIVLGVIVLLIAFGIYKAAGGNKPPQNPDEVITRMMQNMSTVKTAEYAGALKAQLTNTKNPLSSLEDFGATPAQTSSTAPVEFTAGFDGFLDTTNVAKPKAQVTLTLTTPDFTDGQSAEAEFRVLEDNKFFKLNKIPVLGKLNLSSLANIWVNLDTKALQDKFKPATTTVASTTPMTEENREKIRSIVTGAHIIQVAEDMGDEDVSGIATYHYKFTVNEGEVMRVAREVHMVTNGKALTIDEEKKMTSFWNGAEVKNGEIWIGKKDFRIYHVLFGLSGTEMGEKGSSGDFNFDVQMRNFNDPVTIEAPANASSLVDFVGQVFGILMAQSMGSSLMGGK